MGWEYSLSGAWPWKERETESTTSCMYNLGSRAAANTYFHCWLICPLFYGLIKKMSENGKKNYDQCFPKPKTTSSNVLFCPQPKNNQFTVIEERNHLRSWNQKKRKEKENVMYLWCVLSYFWNLKKSKTLQTKWGMASEGFTKQGGSSRIRYRVVLWEVGWSGIFGTFFLNQLIERKTH